jgi:hypothetical protein
MAAVSVASCRRAAREVGSGAGRAILLSLGLLIGSACGTSSTAPTAAPEVVPGTRAGPVQIDYVAASIAPGSTMSGCGPQLAGCLGRLAVTYRLRATTAAPVLRADATLHGLNNLACVSATSAAFTIDANVPYTLTLAFDRFDATCPVPVDIRHMAVTLTGPIQTDSRQEWSVEYRFVP